MSSIRTPVLSFGVARVSNSDDSEFGLNLDVHAGENDLSTENLALRREVQFNRKDVFEDQDDQLLTIGLTYYH